MRRAVLAVTAPAVALLTVGPVVDGLARRLADAPRRLPEESGMAPALDRLGGEVVRLRSRDGLRLSGRWLAADAAGDEDWSQDPREAILLLHGYSGSVTPDLVELGPFLRRTAGVLGLDFRGHGGSDDAPTTFGLNEVEDVAGALTWLGERGIRRVAIVGSSMGGITAIAAVAVLGDGRLASADMDPDSPAAAVDAAASADRGRRGGLGDTGAGPRRRKPAARPLRAPDRRSCLRPHGAHCRRRSAGHAADRRDRPAGGCPAAADPRWQRPDGPDPGMAGGWPPRRRRAPGTW